jgi:hypothetical protein
MRRVFADAPLRSIRADAATSRPVMRLMHVSDLCRSGSEREGRAARCPSRRTVCDSVPRSRPACDCSRRSWQKWPSHAPSRSVRRSRKIAQPACWSRLERGAQGLRALARWRTIDPLETELRVLERDREPQPIQLAGMDQFARFVSLVLATASVIEIATVRRPGCVGAMPHLRGG